MPSDEKGDTHVANPDQTSPNLCETLSMPQAPFQLSNISMRFQFPGFLLNRSGMLGIPLHLLGWSRDDSRWWLNHPFEKVFWSNWITFPGKGKHENLFFHPTPNIVLFFPRKKAGAFFLTNIFGWTKNPQKAEVLGSLSSPFCIFSSTFTCDHPAAGQLNGRGNPRPKKKHWNPQILNRGYNFHKASMFSI